MPGFSAPSRYKQRRREGTPRRQLADAAGQKADRAARTFYARCGELAGLGGKVFWVLVVTPVLTLIAAVQEIVNLHKAAWFWLFLMAAGTGLSWMYIIRA
jgi:hypothetical protein